MSSLSICVETFQKTKCVLQLTRSTATIEKHGGFDQGHLQLVRLCAPHFRRALEFKRQLSHAAITSDYQAAALDNLGVAGFLITPDRSVHSLNDLADTLIDEEDGLKKINNKLVAIEKSDDVKFQKALNEAISLDPENPKEFGLTFSREGCRHGLGVVIKSRPYRSLIRSAHEHCALVFVRKPESLSLADTRLVQQMFDFTPAEARIAIHLARGEALEEIEQAINIRHNTARAHLRSIYQKAEVSSMAQLIHLLSSRTMPTGRFGANMTYHSDRNPVLLDS